MSCVKTGASDRYKKTQIFNNIFGKKSGTFWHMWIPSLYLDSHFCKKKLKCPLVPSPECHNNHSGLYWSLNSHNTQFMQTNTTHILVMPQFYTLSFPTSWDVRVLFLTPIDLRFPPSHRNNSYLNDQPSSAYRWLKTLETHQRPPAAAGCNPYETVIDISGHSNRLEWPGARMATPK